jgi:hypothetical protein
MSDSKTCLCTECRELDDAYQSAQAELLKHEMEYRNMRIRIELLETEQQYRMEREKELKTQIDLYSQLL